MARDGEIQNRSLLRSIADRLDIGGVKRVPPFLNTDTVQVVVDMGRFLDPQPAPILQPPQIGAQTYYYASNSRSIAGLTQDDFEIYPAPATGFQAQILTLELKWHVAIDTTPGTTQVDGYYQLPVGQPFRVFNYNDLFKSSNVIAKDMHLALGGFESHCQSLEPLPTSINWNGYMPSLVPFRIATRKVSPWPANSTLDWRVLSIVWPVGSLKPGTT